MLMDPSMVHVVWGLSKVSGITGLYNIIRLNMDVIRTSGRRVYELAA